MNWQRQLRLAVAIGAVAFIVVLAFAFKPRVRTTRARITPTDPKAVVDSADGNNLRTTGAHEDVRIWYKKLQTYDDGSSRLWGVRIITQRDGGRQFTITSDEGLLKSESDYSLSGHVEIAVSDGMMIHTDRAAYAEVDKMIRAPGPVTIARGRLTGNGHGMIFDKTRNEITLLDRVTVDMAPGGEGEPPMHITAKSALFSRNDKIIHFESGISAIHGAQTIDAPSAVAHLTDDENHLQAIELRGNARIREPRAAAGGLRALTGRDVDLKYAPDGQAIEHATVIGNAVIQLAGESGQAGRQITAHTVEMTLAPDGATPTALSADDSVELVFPPDPASKESSARTITAQTLEAQGEPGRGLTRARFEGSVSYREQASAVDRHATSQTLDASLGAGMSSIDDAWFGRGVRFEDGSMTATATDAHYVLDKGTIALESSRGAIVPRVDTPEIGIDAPHISVTLSGPVVNASGGVKSVLRHQRPPEQGRGARGGASKATKMPSMLKQDQDVVVTAGTLDYDGNESRATYAGDVSLQQGETSIKGGTIVIDDKTGDLTASAAEKKTIVTSMVREEARPNGTVDRVRSNATARDLKYEDAERRLAYSGDAHVDGAAGDMTAAKIEVYLKPSGDEIERVEAFDKMTLREPNGRITTGSRLTYTSSDEMYKITGTPVKLVEACGRNTTGRTLTLFKLTDRIDIDGEQQQTQTVGNGSSCP